MATKPSKHWVHNTGGESIGYGGYVSSRKDK